MTKVPDRARPPSRQRRRRAAGESRTSALLEAKTATLFRHFPAALTGDEEALHQLRVWGRRLRVAVRLLATKPDGRRAQRAERLLAGLTRVAGSTRDLDVLLATFDERLSALPARSPAQRRLRQRLAAVRRRSRARLVERLLDVPIARLRADLATLAARAAVDLATVYERLRETCAREGSKLQNGFATQGGLLDVMALHALRRRARRLRYAVEIHCELAEQTMAATKPWKELQDRIGVLHDHHVLAEWLDGQARTSRQRGQRAIATAASAEATWARQHMARLHDEVLAADPAALVRAGLAAAGITGGPSPP